MDVYTNKELNITLYNADCFEVMQEMKKNSIDLILTDPPYNINMDKDKGWDKINDFSKFTYDFGKLAKNMLKENGSFYWFGNAKNIAYSQIELDKMFYLLNCLVWKKPSYHTMKGANSIYRSYAGVTERILFYSACPDSYIDEKIHKTCFQSIKEYMRGEREKIKTHFNFQKSCEFNDWIGKVVQAKYVASRHYFEDCQWELPNENKYKLLQSTGFFKKDYEELKKDYEELKKDYENGRRVWNNNKKALDVLTFHIIQGKNRLNHPTQKPIELIEYLMRRSSNKNNIVFDGFAGTGTTAIACINLQRGFIGCELDPEYFNLAVTRIKNHIKKMKNIDMFGYSQATKHYHNVPKITK